MMIDSSGMIKIWLKVKLFNPNDKISISLEIIIIGHSNQSEHLTINLMIHYIYMCLCKSFPIQICTRESYKYIVYVIHTFL